MHIEFFLNCKTRREQADKEETEVKHTPIRYIFCVSVACKNSFLSRALQVIDRTWDFFLNQKK